MTLSNWRLCQPYIVNLSRITPRNYLHLRVDDASVLPLPVDVVDLCEVVLLPESGVEDVVHVDWQDVQEARGPGRVDRVASVVRVCPGVGPVGQAPVGQEVEHLQEVAGGPGGRRRSRR